MDVNPLDMTAKGRRTEEEQEKARAEAEERDAELRRQFLREQEQMAREQEEAAERDKKKLVPTAMRLPKGGGRTGYVYDGNIAVAAIAQILEMRTNALVAEGLHDSVGPGDLLPWPLQDKIQKERFRLWSEDFKLFFRTSTGRSSRLPWGLQASPPITRSRESCRPATEAFASRSLAASSGTTSSSRWASSTIWSCSA